jgi:hypothetical protein
MIEDLQYQIANLTQELDAQTSGNTGGGGTNVMQRGWFFAKITSVAAAGTGYDAFRWEYGFAEAYKADKLGYAGNWVVRSGGVTGTAYGLIDHRPETNTDHLTGENIDLDVLASDFAGFSLMPLAEDTLVVVFVAPVSGYAVPEYWIFAPRSVDGACS